MPGRRTLSTEPSSPGAGSQVTTAFADSHGAKVSSVTDVRSGSSRAKSVMPSRPPNQTTGVVSVTGCSEQLWAVRIS